MPAGGRDVGEAQRARAIRRDRQVVAIEPIVGASAREPAALNQIHIEVVVVVEVEERDTRAENLGHVELTRHAVDVNEVEAGGGGAIDKPFRLPAGRRCAFSVGRCSGGPPQPATSTSDTSPAARRTPMHSAILS